MLNDLHVLPKFSHRLNLDKLTFECIFYCTTPAGIALKKRFRDVTRKAYIHSSAYRKQYDWD
jgi:hypothetical protein